MKNKYLSISLSLGLFFISFLLLLAGNCGVPVSAASYTVNTLADENDGSCGDGDCSLRDAVALAAPGSVIDFSVNGTITLTLGYITIGQNLTITGPGAENLEISGNNAGHVFWINSGVSAAISGVTIADGNAQDGGGIFSFGGILDVSDCTFTGNVANNGGGIRNSSSGTLTVTGCTFILNNGGNGAAIDNRGTLSVTGSAFISNTATGWGGGVYNYTNNQATVDGSLFTGNKAQDGSGICNHKGALDVTGSEFSGNDAKSNGGGIYSEKPMTINGSAFYNNSAARGGGICSSNTLILTGSEFRGNAVSSSISGGGAILIPSTGVLDITDCAFYTNTASIAPGGAISNYGILTVTYGSIISNTGIWGGGIYNSGNLSISRSSFYSNTAHWGGGIENAAPPEFKQTAYFANRTGEIGGSIENLASLIIDRTTFFANRSIETGGGICSHDTLNITNSTFFSNTAGSNGGGINNEDELAITNSTFFSNTASDGGGINNNDSATLINTIIGSSITGGDCGGSPLQAASKNNLSTGITCSEGFSQTTGISLTLEWTGWLFELGTGSAAIDAGDNASCPPVDQLGQRRPCDGDGDGAAICDVGSFEVQSAGFAIYLPLVVRN